MYKQYINGVCVEGDGADIKVLNPHDGSTVDSLKGATIEQALGALEAAELSFKTWSWTSINERVEWLNKIVKTMTINKEKIARLLSAETGKTYENACHDFQMCIDTFVFYSEEVKRVGGTTINDYNASRGKVYHVVEKRPLGVVVGYLAWNFPLFNFALKVGPTIASGCCCVLKPSSQTPLTTLFLGELMAEMGLPNGVVNLVVGNASEIGYALNTSEIPKMITLIGSTETGRQVMKEGATSIKAYSLELGGNAPVIVMDDADVELAAQLSVDLKTYNAGQTCTDYNRIYVHESIYDQYCDLVAEGLKKVTLGIEPQEGNIVMGPMINMNARDRMLKLIDEAVSGGARLVSGGNIPQDMKNGNYITPALLIDVDETMKVYKEEIFGPIISVIPYNDYEKVLQQAIDTEYGLSSYLFTHDSRAITRAFEVFESGEILVNGDFHASYLPHGGVKQSGIGCDCSSLSLNEYYVTKRLSMMP